MIIILFLVRFVRNGQARSVKIRVLPRLTLFKPFYASIASPISTKLRFRMSSSAFLFTVLHITTCSMCSLRVLFSNIYLRFFIRAIVGDDSLGFVCFLVCFAMLVAICWINSVRVLYRVSVSSSYSLLPTSVSVRGETRSTLFQSVLLPALVFSVTEPITIMWSLLFSLPNVDAV